MSQQAVVEVCTAAVGVDQFSLRVFRHGIDGQVAP